MRVYKGFNLSSASGLICLVLFGLSSNALSKESLPVCRIEHSFVTFKLYKGDQKIDVAGGGEGGMAEQALVELADDGKCTFDFESTLKLVEHYSAPNSVGVEILKHWHDRQVKKSSEENAFKNRAVACERDLRNIKANIDLVSQSAPSVSSSTLRKQIDEIVKNYKADGPATKASSDHGSAQ